jgi:hypothetical protein
MASSETADAVVSDKPASPSENEVYELDAADTPEIADASSDNESDELVCRREKQAGSNFSRKVCYTRAQIDARAQKDQDAVRQMRRPGTYVDKDSGGG